MAHNHKCEEGKQHDETQNDFGTERLACEAERLVSAQLDFMQIQILELAFELLNLYRNLDK